MILIVDNFDSFTYNLVDYFEQLGEECEVIRNDVYPEEIHLDRYKAVVLSPGPGKPEEAGFLMDYIRIFENELPILGICLGHQAIAKYYGAEIVKADKPMHGKISSVQLLTNDELFREMKTEFNVVRYHSLVVENLENNLLLPLAITQNGEIMILKHHYLSIYGIQYHPEAALTDYGLKILLNWKEILGKENEAIVNKLH